MARKIGGSAPIPVVIFVKKVGRRTLSTMASTQNTVATVDASATPPTLWQNTLSADDSLTDQESEADADKVLDDNNDTETEADGIVSVATGHP